MQEYEATYAVAMHCAACARDVRRALEPLQGVSHLAVNAQDQILSVRGTAPPSAVVAALRRSGRDAVVRGTGAPNSSAVAILETFAALDLAQHTTVRGLARLVQVAPDRCLFDITVNGVPNPGNYLAEVHANGDLSRGHLSTGPAVYTFPEPIVVRDASSLADGLYAGSAFVSADLSLQELTGRSIVLTHQRHKDDIQPAYTICGVVARSAGVWENTKQVCACTGKTIWEERQDALRNNIA